MIRSYLSKIKHLLLPYYYSLKKNYYDHNNQPIFLVSSNRSGSSLISSILRQHTKLRSLSEDLLNDDIKMKNGHTLGFAEDNVWQFLDDPLNDHYRRKNQGFLWSHPKYISEYYREDYSKFKKALYYQIYKVRSDKIPLVKHSFFSLRLKLIKKIFPEAKIIFNIRSYKDFIRSNYNKYLHDVDYGKEFKTESPDIGLHWYMLNSTVFYHLNKYFKKQYHVVFHEKFYDEKYDNQKIMDEITDFLSIERFNFSFENVNKNYKFSKDIDFNYHSLKDILEISDYENHFLKNMIKEKK
jgi:hypothetical protein